LKRTKKKKRGVVKRANLVEKGICFIKGGVLREEGKCWERTKAVSLYLFKKSHTSEMVQYWEKKRGLGGGDQGDQQQRAFKKLSPIGKTGARNTLNRSGKKKSQRK